MVEHDVDFLLGYLDSFPEFRKSFKNPPPRILWRGRWRMVQGVRKLASGVEIRCGGGARVRLVPSSRTLRSRENQKKRLLTLIQGYWVPDRILGIFDKTDRNRHQTEAILRVHLRVGDKSVAALGVYENESPELSSRLLSSLVAWWDVLSGVDFASVFFPEKWSERLLDLLPYLSIPVVCCKYRLDIGEVRKVYPSPDRISRVQSPYLIYPMLSEAPQLFVELSREFPALDLLFRHGKWELSYRGLPVAWLDEAGSLHFDLQHPKRITQLKSLRDHIGKVMKHRQYPSPDPNHFYFRFGEERWLESLVLKAHRKINPEFTTQIYSQVPTWVDGERKVLDLLTATTQGRLAVMELKTRKDPSLVFQGLDYWERVEHHRIRSDFAPAGYFTEMDLTPLPPLLYLISPLFEFHRLSVIIRRYLKKDLRVFCIGINTEWKKGIKILRRFTL